MKLWCKNTNTFAIHILNMYVCILNAISYSTQAADLCLYLNHNHADNRTTVSVILLNS